MLERRDSHDLAARRRVVLAQRSRGLSAAAFWRREGIPHAAFYFWRRQLKISGAMPTKIPLVRCSGGNTGTAGLLDFGIGTYAIFPDLYPFTVLIKQFYPCLRRRIV